jgi:DHA2 family multidrug resistance protein-like MFS transporter
MQDVTLAEPGPRAGRREWIGLAVLALPTLLVALDIGALFLALPHLSADLGASSTEQLWITDIYGFLLAGFLITMGTLGDRIGRRRLLLIGAAAFTVASVLAAYSTSPEMLIVARALLGIAGATLSPSTLALISNMFRDAQQRGKAISLWATCQFAGAALGPVIGGLLLQHFWWGSVFLLGVPVMALLLVFGPMLLPEYRDIHAGRLDLASVALSLAAILPLIYGIKELAVHGAQSPALAIMAIVAGAAVGALFVRRQLRLSSPLLDLRLFGDRSFSITLSAMALGSAALAGTSLMTSQYVQSVIGLAPAQAGLWQAPTGLGIAAGVLLAPALTQRITPSRAIVAGLALSAAGLLLLTQVGSAGGLVVVVLGIAVVAFGVGPLFVLGTGLVVGSAPPEKAGAAAALSETSNIFGSTLGLAVLGSIGAAVYRHQLAGSTLAGIPAEAAQTARETIAAATAVAGQLPAVPAALLLDAARAAFTAGLNVVAAIGAIIFIALAILIATALRRLHLGGEAADRGESVADGVQAR